MLRVLNLIQLKGGGTFFLRECRHNRRVSRPQVVALRLIVTVSTNNTCEIAAHSGSSCE